MSNMLLHSDHQVSDEEATVRTEKEIGIRPPEVPEKFWDEDRQALRTDSLIKSYAELERRFSSSPNGAVPASPDDYNIDIKNELLTADPDINAKLHSAGFSAQQAQLVYDLASEKLLPLVNEIAAMFEAEAQIERLTRDFGGEDRWREASRQIANWAKANLPEPVFAAMSMTYEGVTALHRMMVGEEPTLIQIKTGGSAPLDEGALRDLMGDPRYWRDQDPAVVRKVQEGFRALYGD